MSWTDEQGRRFGRRYGAGLVISQVVPWVSSNSSAALRYRQHLDAYNPQAIPGEFSFETYLNMSLFGEALEVHGPDLTTETLVETLEDFAVDLGVGTSLGFTIGSHQAATRVWGLRLNEQLEIEPLGILVDR